MAVWLHKIRFISTSIHIRNSHNVDINGIPILWLTMELRKSCWLKYIETLTLTLKFINWSSLSLRQHGKHRSLVLPVFSLQYRCWKRILALQQGILNQFLFVGKIQSNKSQSGNPAGSQVIYLRVSWQWKTKKRFCGTK